jgi:hypothetical protein
MQPTDHKAVLRKLATVDGCQASLKAAAHIEYLERQLTSARDYQEQLRRKLGKVRHQRDTLRRQLMGEEHVGVSDIRADHLGGLVNGRGCNRDTANPAVAGA